MRGRDRAIAAKMAEEVSVALGMMGRASLGDFLGDEKLKRAVCMTVINVGELTKGLSDEFRAAHGDVPWRAIAGFRDVAAHKYQTLRMDDVYRTVSDDFPELGRRLAEILEEP